MKDKGIKIILLAVRSNDHEQPRATPTLVEWVLTWAAVRALDSPRTITFRREGGALPVIMSIIFAREPHDHLRDR